MKLEADIRQTSEAEVSYHPCMWNDPIVEETRELRDELAARFNYDVRALGQYYKSQQTAENRVIVNRSPKREKAETKDTVLTSDRSS